MIKIEYTDIWGWQAAIRGVRNPMNSWGRTDTIFGVHNSIGLVIGENDLKLMQNLVKAGSDHAKFMRFINVTFDVEAPLYWWKEFKTYRAGRKFADSEPDSIPDEYMEYDIEMNSCSTMHKIHDKPFTVDDFSHEHLTGVDEEPIKLIFDSENPPEPFNSSAMGCLEITVAILNYFRKLFLETGDKKWWWQMIQLLPTSYNQRRTLQLNYAVLRNMYHARKEHKLDEWRDFCKWVETLPYAMELIVYADKQ